MTSNRDHIRGMKRGSRERRWRRDNKWESWMTGDGFFYMAPRFAPKVRRQKSRVISFMSLEGWVNLGAIEE